MPSEPPSNHLRRGLAAAAAATVALVVLSGCQIGETRNDLANGKRLFVEKCAACHQLARADTKGVSGPDLDEAFRQARADGMNDQTFEGMILAQIANPSLSSAMPADLVTGEDAEDVAAYVAQAAAVPGKDEGALAEAGGKKPGAGKIVVAAGGALQLDADPGGQLAYVAGAATAGPGSLTIKSRNDAQVPHNIALEGGGVDEVGEIVQSGGVSEISVDLKPGEYAFYCSVPGHREGGMEGKLTVK